MKTCHSQRAPLGCYTAPLKNEMQKLYDTESPIFNLNNLHLENFRGAA